MQAPSSLKRNDTTSSFLDGSRLITEACVRAGADVFIGYPITPANLLYLYATTRFPIMLAAPDEITTLQWMSGFAITGALPVTATSFPGYAILLESVNMAYMMELPMVITLVQRLGPATGTATAGAQGDLALLNGTISGGMSLLTLCISDLRDCWQLTAQAVEAAVRLRTPVVLLTSKEMVMTKFSFDTATLPAIQKVHRKFYDGDERYHPYKPDETLVPPFLPVTNTRHQVRITASTHDEDGILKNLTPDAMANTRRLHEKHEHNLPSFTFFEYDEQQDAEVLIISFDITALAAKEAVQILRADGVAVSHLVAKTLFPVPPEYLDIAERYKRIIVAEENLTGQYRRILFGVRHGSHIQGVNAIGKMISPQQIISEVVCHE